MMQLMRLQRCYFPLLYASRTMNLDATDDNKAIFQFFGTELVFQNHKQKQNTFNEIN